jgi:hypothetical protein
MKAEYTAEDFKNAVRNPIYHKLNRKVTVGIRHTDYAIFEDAAKSNGAHITPEDIMRRCLADYAKRLKDHP